jgi:hypothetical protein
MHYCSYRERPLICILKLGPFEFLEVVVWLYNNKTFWNAFPFASFSISYQKAFKRGDISDPTFEGTH